MLEDLINGRLASRAFEDEGEEAPPQYNFEQYLSDETNDRISDHEDFVELHSPVFHRLVPGLEPIAHRRVSTTDSFHDTAAFYLFLTRRITELEDRRRRGAPSRPDSVALRHYQAAYRYTRSQQAADAVPRTHTQPITRPAARTLSLSSITRPTARIQVADRNPPRNRVTGRITASTIEYFEPEYFGPLDRCNPAA